jgi:DNA-directed RNA polymerase specialized sigma24 family protein
MTGSGARELYRHYVGVLAPWKVRLAIGRLRRFRLPPHVWADAMQDLALAILGFRFDTERAGTASERTILCRLIDNRIRRMVRAYGRYEALRERVAGAAEPAVDEHTPDEPVELRELQALVADLPEDERAVCRRLMEGQSICQIARETGRCWHTINRRVARIRYRLEQAGYAEPLDA